MPRDMPEFKEIEEPEERKRLGLDINKKVGMELDSKWFWKNRVLDCRVRAETGNPAGDDLRERLAALTGVSLQDILKDMQKEKKDAEKKSKGTVVDHEKEKKFKEVLKRTHVAGAAQLSLTNMKILEDADAKDKSKKNINKAYCVKPKSPSKRVVMDALRETGKPNPNPPNAEEAKLAAARLEKKLAKARLKRQEQMDEAAKGEQEDDLVDTMLTTSLIGAVLPKQYKGDLFGTSGDLFEGTLYLSRMLNSTQKAKWSDPFITYDETEASDSQVLGSVGVESLEEGDGSLEFSAAEQGVETDVASKLFCAISLTNWSRNPANAQRLAAEGAVKALMKLSIEPFPEILKFCSAGFRFMSEHPSLAVCLIDDGAIRVISDVALNSLDDFVLCNFSVALLNLTRCNGRESKAVDEGILSGFSNIMKNAPELGIMCCRGAYNLTCVDAPYQSIEKVISFLNEVAGTGTADIKHICAAAICNMSDMSILRLKMIEANILPILNVLTRGTDLKTRRVSAVILQNFASTPKCRVEMVARNCISTAYNLSSDNDPVVLRCIAVSLSKLAMDSANSVRMVNDGGAMALCNIAVKFASVPGISYPTASAFHFLSSKPQTRITIAQEGSIVAISLLLRQSQDFPTLRKTLCSLCNLLIEPDTHLVIMQQGLIATLNDLAKHENQELRELVALAFVNFSLTPESHKHIISSDGVASVIKLSADESTECKRRCAAAISNLSGLTTGIQQMVKDGVIPALTDLMNQGDNSIIKFACAALCRLSSSEENGELITKSGVLPMLVRRSIEADTETKKFCGSTFSFLSFFESCRSALCKNDIFSALQNLSEESDESSRLRCLAAFGNLSCDREVQNDLVQSGIVEIIKDLANSYQEFSLQCCAKALCNLSCCGEARLKIVTDGGDEVLMMISMVRSSDIVTKTVCVNALANLIDENTAAHMINKGLVQTISNLCRQPEPINPDPDLLKFCIYSFNLVSNFDEGKINIGAKQSQLWALLGCYDNTDDDGKLICARTVANLVLTDAVHKQVCAAGAIRILEAGAKLEDEETSMHCLRAIFMASAETDIYREEVARSGMKKDSDEGSLQGIPDVLVSIASSSYGEKYNVCCKTLALLSYYENSRLLIHHKSDFFSSLIDLVLNTEVPDMVESLALSIFYSIVDYPFIDEIDVTKLVQTFQALLLLNEQLGAMGGHSPLVMQSLVGSIRELCKHEFLVNQIATAATVSIFSRALTLVQGDNNMVYNIAAALNTLVKYGSEHRVNLASSPMIVDVLCTLLDGKNAETNLEMCTSILTAFCLDAKSRPSFSDSRICDLFVKIIGFAKEDGYTKDSYNYLYNSISAIYALSKIPAARVLLLDAAIDGALEKIPVSSDKAELKTNVNRAIKNLASEAEEALEEGTITSLIAMSLEGKKNHIKEDVIQPDETPQDYKSSGPPAFFLIDGDFSLYSTYAMSFEATLGGSAGKGPTAPDAPSMDMESSDAFSTPEYKEELAAELSVEEGKSKMAFAKMKVPEELRTSYLLTDDDFKNEEEKLAKAQQAKEDAEAVGESGLPIGEASFDDAGGDYQEIPLDAIIDAATPQNTTPKTKMGKSGSFRANSNNSKNNSNSSAGNSPNATPVVSARNSMKSSRNASPTNSPKVSQGKKLAAIDTKTGTSTTTRSSINNGGSVKAKKEKDKLGLY